MLQPKGKPRMQSSTSGLTGESYTDWLTDSGFGVKTYPTYSLPYFRTFPHPFNNVSSPPLHLLLSSPYNRIFKGESICFARCPRELLTRTKTPIPDTPGGGIMFDYRGFSFMWRETAELGQTNMVKFLGSEDDKRQYNQRTKRKVKCSQVPLCCLWGL